MRPIESEEQKEQKRKKRITTISIILLFIMVVSTIGYAFTLFSENNSSRESKASSDEQIQTESGQWVFPFENKNLLLRSSKESVKNISVEIFVNIENYKNMPVYIDTANSSSIYQEIAYSISTFSYKLPAEACYGPCKANLPEKNCSDYLIVYNKSNENKVSQVENCIFIEGDIRGVDAFLYKLFETA